MSQRFKDWGHLASTLVYDGLEELGLPAQRAWEEFRLKSLKVTVLRDESVNCWCKRGQNVDSSPS